MSDNVVDLAEEKLKRSDTGSKIQILDMILASANMRNLIFGRDGDFRFNQLTEQVELGGTEVQLERHNLFGYRLAMSVATGERSGENFEVASDTLLDAICHRAALSAYHPIEDWVRSNTWDGVDRLGGGLPAAFGVTPGTIQATFLRLTMRAMVARLTRPGCKVDTVLVLVGGQGKSKSMSLADLTGKAWFSDDYIDIANKDSWELVHRFWVLEFAELSAFKKSDVESIKAFITRGTDTYRSPYGKRSTQHKRRSVFVGTTNDQEFLTDTTGNRRFWPIEIDEKPIDQPWLAANRGQVFAQALVEIDAGAIWWLSKDEEKQHLDAACRHVVPDDWDEKIGEWMRENPAAGRAGVSASSILKNILEIELKHQRGLFKRLAACLRKSGAFRSKNTSNRDWFW